MGIPILGEIEKLINEHGSAVILKERLALAADQYSALEQKNAAFDLRNKELETEKRRLELDNQKLREKVRDLEDKLVERRAQPLLEEVREKILLLLAKRNGSTITEISKSLNIEAQLGTFHLNELLTIKFVHHPAPYGSSPRWSIAQEGRRYLVNHGLL